MGQTLFGFADEIGRVLVISRAPKEGKFFCEFEGALVREKVGINTYKETTVKMGKGDTAEQAMRDYAEHIKGLEIMFEMLLGQPQWLSVPADLTY